MDPYASDPTLGATKDDEGEEKGCSIDGPPPPPRNSSSLASVYCDRLRIHAGDGYKLLPKLPDGSLAAVLVIFPDPFPKETDATYRLVQHQTLIECHRILRKAERRCSSTGTNADSISINTATDNNSHALKRKGRLFLATDHDGYHEWCHRIMHEVNASSSPLFELEQPCPNRMEWLPAVSRYEQKGWDEGRSTKLTCWVAI
jgi:tRNA G46 methylase TrmB